MFKKLMSFFTDDGVVFPTRDSSIEAREIRLLSERICTLTDRVATAEQISVEAQRRVNAIHERLETYNIRAGHKI